MQEEKECALTFAGAWLLVYMSMLASDGEGGVDGLAMTTESWRVGANGLRHVAPDLGKPPSF